MTIETPLCGLCKHRTGSWSCDAFDIIPREIMFNKFDHHKPYKGDHGILFEGIRSDEK